MATLPLLRGLLLGLSIAAPVGPIGVLCIRRTLALGWLAGFVAGLGAATADGFYGGVAGFGLTAISSFLLGARSATHLIGGVFLLYLGVRTLRARPSETTGGEKGPTRLSGAYLSTVLLTLTNPTTILSFAAIFAGLGVVSTGNFGSAASLVAGVFLGSALWWLLLSGGVALLRRHFDARVLLWTNRISGGILCAFGVLALVSLRG